MRAVTLCADDFALTPAVSTAILDLATAGRISAVSCMTQSPYWRDYGPALAPLSNTIDVGLHLVLVEEVPLTRMPNTAPGGRLPPLGTLLMKSYLRKLDLAEIAGEIDAQIAAFTDVIGRPPSHIDGHLHAHVLPGISTLVLDAAGRLSPRPWLRTTTDKVTSIVRRGHGVTKALVLALLGRAFTSAARGRFETNEGFSGCYDFAGKRAYAALFPAFLRAPGPRHLILCHPGAPGDDAAWAAARASEHAFLRDELDAVLKDRRLRTERLSSTHNG